MHVVTEPWTPYIRFEVDQHYPRNAAVGEDVRLVHAAKPWEAPDFWLVDDAGWTLSYDPEGGMTVETTSGAALRELWSYRDVALAESEPLPPSVTR